MLLPSEGTPFCEPSFASGGLTQHSRATDTKHDRLRVAEHRCDLITSWTLDVHEIRIGTLYETLLLVRPPLLLRGRMQQVFCEWHVGED